MSGREMTGDANSTPAPVPAQDRIWTGTPAPLQNMLRFPHR